jgi:hypothetical protein
MAYGSSHFFAGCDLAFSRSQPAPTFGDHGAVTFRRITLPYAQP